MSDLSSPDLHAILDLCIECKGCKGECPSQVDMAKMKSEALFHYQERYGYSLRSRLFAHLDTLSRLSHPFHSLYNWFVQTAFSRKLLTLLGIAGPLPQLAQERFSTQLARLTQPAEKPLVLLNDTYTEFYCPEVGLSAIRVLNHWASGSTVPAWCCCGGLPSPRAFCPSHASAKNAATILRLPGPRHRT